MIRGIFLNSGQQLMAVEVHGIASDESNIETYISEGTPVVLFESVEDAEALCEQLEIEFRLIT